MTVPSDPFFANLDPAIYRLQLRPDVTVYPRHSPDCRFQSPGLVSKCACKKYIYVARTPQTKESRIATYTRSWETANEQAQRIRDSFNPEKRELETLKARERRAIERDEVRIDTALADWVADKETNKPMGKIDRIYYTVQTQLQTFAEERGLVYISQLTTPELTRFRNRWQNKKKGGIKHKQSRLVAFFAFCVRMGWLDDNPAGGRLNPEGGLSKVTGEDWEPMVPLTREQYSAVLDACARYPVYDRYDSYDIPTRLHTFTQLLRWSGLSPIDALKLRTDQLDADDVLTLSRAKTGKQVAVKLPAPVAEALRKVPRPRTPHPDYFFWNGSSSDESLRATYLKWYRTLWPLVEPKLELWTLKGKRYRPHPYIFRCTFAVEFLSSPNTSVFDLAKLLGNTVAMCEKHYVPLVARLKQNLLDRQQETFAAQGAPSAPSASGKLVRFPRPRAVVKVGS